MNYIGIDISKAWFDCYSIATGEHRQFENTPQGWQALGTWDQHKSWVVMEATGPYFLGLASWLAEQGWTVSVINPLVIRRYSQMRLERTKTDAKDAALIARYAASEPLVKWSPSSAKHQRMRQLMSLRALLVRQRNMQYGWQEAFNQAPIKDAIAEAVLQDHEQIFRKQINQLEQEVERLIESIYAREYACLQTIPGIGKKTAAMLLVLTHGFTRFDTARKVASYVGLCPRIWESGKSTKGAGHICKMGSSELRKLLYMCTWSAKRCNPACKAMYDRLKQAGKPERVIKVALAHKLLRQAFSVGKLKIEFDPGKALAA